MVIPMIIVVFIEFPVFFFWQFAFTNWAFSICLFSNCVSWQQHSKKWLFVILANRVLQLDKGRWLYDSDTNINKEVFFKLIIYLERGLIKELKKRSKLHPSWAADIVSAVCCVSNITSNWLFYVLLDCSLCDSFLCIKYTDLILKISSLESQMLK